MSEHVQARAWWRVDSAGKRLVAARQEGSMSSPANRLARSVRAPAQARSRSSSGPAWSARTAADPPDPRAAITAALQRVELRHLRYFVAVAEAGTFTAAAESSFVAQPTLSQQIRRLEEMVGAPLLERRRDGVHMTEPGRVLLEESRSLLSLVENGLVRTRSAAGLGRQRLRVVAPPQLPESLLTHFAQRLAGLAREADIEVTWAEAAVDGGLTVLNRRKADAALCWLPADARQIDPELDSLVVGDVEPSVWLEDGPTERLGCHDVGDHGRISIEQLAELEVFHGPRAVAPLVHDSWLSVLRPHRDDFSFRPPLFGQRWTATLAGAEYAGRARAVLTGPEHPVSRQPWTSDTPGSRALSWPRPMGEQQAGLRELRIADGALSAIAGLVWCADLPRSTQQLHDPSSRCWLVSCFSATARSSTSSSASQTAPMPPVPRSVLRW
jgi:DNA-binding transcriptional LysR family regulator